MSKISIVTAFFDIGRGEWTPDKGLPHYLQRSTDVYIKRFSYLLNLDTDITVYTSPDLVNTLTELSVGKLAKTTIVGIDLSEFDSIKERIVDIQQNELFKNSISPNQLKNPEYWNSDYVLVTNLKAYFVDLSIKNGLSKNDMVAWIDFGYCRSEQNIPQSNSWEYNFDPTKLHLFAYKQYDGKNILEIIATNDVYILGAKVVAHKSMWSIMAQLMKSSQDKLFENNFVDDDQGLWLISSLMEPYLFELHTIPDHQLGGDPFVLFNEFNDTV
jgi:protein YibB